MMPAGLFDTGEGLAPRIFLKAEKMAAKKKINPQSPIPEETALQTGKEWDKTLDGMNDGICLLSIDQKILRCNRAMATIVRKKREEIMGRYCFEVVHGTDKPLPDCPIARMRKSLMRETMELERNGRWLDVTVDPILDETGELAGILHIVRDITERKKTEKALLDSEKRYRSIVENVNDAFYIHDFNGTILDCNDNACRLLGFSREELVGSNLGKTGTPGQHRLTPERMAVLKKEGSLVFDGENTRKDGQVIAVNISARVVSYEGNGIIQSFVRDITERKKTEESLRESEEKYRILSEFSPEMIYLVDGNGVVRYVNKAALAMFKGGTEGVVGKNLRDLYPPAVAERHLNAIRSIIISGRAVSRELYEEFQTGKRWIDAHLSPVKDSKGTTIGVLGLSADITERKKTEEALRKSEELLKAQFENSPDIIIILDRQLKYLSINQIRIGPYSGEELIGRDAIEVLPQDERDRVRNAVLTCFDTGAIQEIEHQVGDGMWVRARIVPLTKENGVVRTVMVISTDITERRKIEERMARDEKLESLQVFAGGIAHDFNNLLTGIFGNIELARVELPDDNPAQHYLNNSFMAFGRAKHLAQQLLTFAKGGVPQKKTLRLPELIMNACVLALSGANVKAEYCFASGLWPVEADENQLSQVFSNLIINAWQAMPQGGIVTITAENRTLEEKQLGELNGGKYVAAMVEDRGIGIPATIIDKIFDPFFTTKQQGSGLGLATSYSIIRHHGGTIEVASEQGKGTVFTLWLPATEKLVADDKCAGRITDLRGSGRILIMDDEGLIRRIVYDMLSMAGYEVTTATEGREVVKKYREAFEIGKKFDAVILDLTVPGGMGGTEAIKEILKIDPSALAIVSSGYSDTAVMADFAEHGFAARVPKPYSFKELLGTVKKVMESRKK
jgi:PAS domain S-box-containing protein